MIVVNPGAVVQLYVEILIIMVTIALVGLFICMIAKKGGVR